jgi:cytochrome c556
MLYTMFKATILISALAFSAFGLFAQDELATYQASMKAAAGANGAIRSALNANDTATVSAKAKDMSAAFDTIAAFWKAKGKDDAVKFAEAASAVGKATAAATTIDDQKAAMGKLGPNCQGCHALYRDGNKFKGL